MAQGICVDQHPCIYLIMDMMFDYVLCMECCAGHMTAYKYKYAVGTVVNFDVFDLAVASISCNRAAAWQKGLTSGNLCSPASWAGCRGARKDKTRKEYIFWHQSNEKPRITPVCPGN